MKSFIDKNVKEFCVQGYVNDEYKEYTLEDIKGKWSLFFFYPGDFTFVCPTELEDLQKLYEDFKEVDTEIYGISTDSEHVHKAWHDNSERISKVEYPLLSDKTHELSKQFGVLIKEAGQSRRGAFIINPDGVITAYEVSADGVGRNAKELLRKVKACQFVEKHSANVCPASWEPGDDILEPGIDLVGKL